MPERKVWIFVSLEGYDGADKDFVQKSGGETSWESARGIPRKKKWEDKIKALRQDCVQ
jgi:hypothetical protein